MSHPKPQKSRRIGEREPRKRRHHRHCAWESFTDPILAVDDNPIALPQPIDASYEPQLRSAKVEVMRRRHELRRHIWHPDDTANEFPDLTGNLIALSKFIAETALADRGFRSAAHGISKTKNGYRAQYWDSAENRHRHVGYATTEAQARRLLEKFYADEFGIDTTTELPEWLQEVVRWSAIAQSEQDAENRDRIARKWVDDDDEPDPTGRTLSEDEELVRLILVTFGHRRPLTAEQIVHHAAGDDRDAILKALASLCRRGEHMAFKHEAGEQTWYSASRTDYERQLQGMMRMIGG